MAEEQTVTADPTRADDFVAYQDLAPSTSTLTAVPEPAPAMWSAPRPNTEGEGAGIVGVAPETHTAPQTQVAECATCHQPGRYYDDRDWCDEVVDGNGALVLMGSKYSDTLICFECEKQLDAAHTEKWVEVWAQRPRPFTTRRKDLSRTKPAPGGAS